MIRNKTLTGPIVIDLTGPHGNAFYLLGVATTTARKLGMDPAPILEDMKAGNYDELVECFDEYFGDYFILER